MKRKTLLLFPTALALTGAAPAAISLTNQDSVDFLGGSTDSHTFSSFDLTGGNAIAVTLGFETPGGLADYSVTYGAESLTVAASAVDTGAGAQTAAVFYLINPASSVADLTISVPPFDRFTASVVALSNVIGIASTGTDGSTDGTADLTLNYSGLAGDFLVAASMDNSFTFNADVAVDPAISGDNTPLTALQIVNGGTNPEGGSGAWAGPIGSSGSFTTTVDVHDNSSRNAGVAVVFSETVPEPSVALLGGLGLLGLLRRRRS